MVSAVTTSYRAEPFPYPEEAPASQALFDRARAIVPGGVNSPVRAFRAVGGTPRFMAEGSGAWLVAPVWRPGLLVGSADPRPCASADHRGGPGRRSQGHQLRYAHRGRGRPRRGD